MNHPLYSNYILNILLKLSLVCHQNSFIEEIVKPHGVSDIHACINKNGEILADYLLIISSKSVSLKSWTQVQPACKSLNNIFLSLNLLLPIFF